MKEYENLKQLVEDQLESKKNNSMNETILDLLMRSDGLKGLYLSTNKDPEVMKIIEENFDVIKMLLDIKLSMLKDDKETETKLINEGFKKYNIILGGKDNGWYGQSFGDII